MKILFAAVFVCIALGTSFAQDTLVFKSPPETVNDLYFCKTYTDKENGRSSFFIVSTEDTTLDITAMVRLASPIGVKHVLLKVFRTGEDDKDMLAYTQDYDIQPEWDYIFFADVILGRKPGLQGNSESFVYTAVLYNDIGTEIIRNSTPLNVMFMQ